MTAMTHSTHWQCKVEINRALDQAAGYELSIDARADWWITDSRYLRIYDGADACCALLVEARSSVWT